MDWDSIVDFDGILKNFSVLLSKCIAAIFYFLSKVIASQAVPKLNQNWLEQYNKILAISLVFFAVLLIVLFSKLSRAGQDVGVASLMRSAFGRIPIVLILLFCLPIFLDKLFEMLELFVAGLVKNQLTDLMHHFLDQFNDTNAIKGLLSAPLYILMLLFMDMSLIPILGAFLLEVSFGHAIWLILSIFFPLYLVAYIYPPWGKKLNIYLNLLLSILISPIVSVFVFFFILNSILPSNIIVYDSQHPFLSAIHTVTNMSVVCINFIILDIIPLIVLHLLRAGGVMSHGVSSSVRHARGAMSQVAKKAKQGLNDRIKYLDAPSQRTNRFKNSLDAIRGKGNTPDFKSSVLRSPILHGKNANKVKDPKFAAPKTTFAAAAVVKGAQKTHSAIKNTANKARENIQGRIKHSENTGQQNSYEKYNTASSGGYSGYLLNKNNTNTNQGNIEQNKEKGQNIYFKDNNTYLGGHKAYILNKNNNKDKK